MTTEPKALKACGMQPVGTKLTTNFTGEVIGYGEIKGRLFYQLEGDDCKFDVFPEHTRPAEDRKADEDLLGLLKHRDQEICLAIFRTMARLGFVTPQEAYGTRVTDATNDLRQALQDTVTERDALKAQIERLTSDAAVEAACRADVGLPDPYTPSLGKRRDMRSALAAALRVAKGEG